MFQNKLKKCVWIGPNYSRHDMHCPRMVVAGHNYWRCNCVYRMLSFFTIPGKEFGCDPHKCQIGKEIWIAEGLPNPLPKLKTHLDALKPKCACGAVVARSGNRCKGCIEDGKLQNLRQKIKRRKLARDKKRADKLAKKIQKDQAELAQLQTQGGLL